MEAAATHQEDQLSLVRQRLLSLSPAAVLAPLRNLRLLMSVTATRVFEDNPTSCVDKPEIMPQAEIDYMKENMVFRSYDAFAYFRAQLPKGARL